MTGLTVFTAQTTQTYKRRSKKERKAMKEKLEKMKVSQFSKENEISAMKQRRINAVKHRNLAYQLCSREISGKATALNASKPHYSPVDSLLSIYQRKLTGTSLSRLSVLTKGNKELEKNLLDGNLCLLGYPSGCDSHPLPMIGYRLNDHHADDEETLDTWRSNLWQKSVELFFMEISYHSVSFTQQKQASSPKKIARSSSVTSNKEMKSFLSRSSSLAENDKQILQASKPIAFIHPITTITCCTVGVEAQGLCVHQSEDKNLFFVYSGQKEKKKSLLNQPTIKKPKGSTLPNSTATKIASQPATVAGNTKLDFSHFTFNPTGLGSYSLSPLNDLEEETEGYLCILPSPLEYGEPELPCASLHISFPSFPNTVAFLPKYCVYEGKYTVYLLLNLKHSLYRVKLSYDPSESSTPPEHISSGSDSVSFRYFTHDGEEASFVHPRAFGTFNVDRFLFTQVNQNCAQLSRHLLHFSTSLLGNVSDSVVLVQIVYYAFPPTASREEMKVMRGGFILQLDIKSGQHDILHTIQPHSFRSQETVDEWATRMNHITSTMLTPPPRTYCPDFTWDNSAYITGTPMKLLAHPTFPFVLVNDLLHQRI